MISFLQIIIQEHLATIVGYIAVFIALVGYFQKDDSNTVKLVILGNIFWIIYFIILGIYTAIIASCITIIRLFLSLKYKRNKKVFLGVITVTIIMGIYSYTDHISILPLIGTCVAAYGYFFFEGVRLRMFLVISSLFWLTFDLHINSIPGIIKEGLVQAILILTMIKMIKDEQQRNYFVDKIMSIVEKRNKFTRPDLDRYLHISDFVTITRKRLIHIYKYQKKLFLKNYKSLKKQITKIFDYN